VKPGNFALAADFTMVHAGSITSAGYSLTLSTYTAGARYLPPRRGWPLQPFGQVLLGLAHSSGTLVAGGNPGTQNATASVAANIGGGLDLENRRRIAIRLMECDYLITTIHNGGNNRQNNLRISTGVLIHF
jgi:hypothetical protein